MTEKNEFQFPRLYLELLENKKKVKSNLLYEEFIDYSAEKIPLNSPIVSKIKESQSIKESLLNDLLESRENEIESVKEVPELKKVIPKELYNDVFTPKVEKPKKIKISPKVVNPESLIKKQQLLMKFDILRKNANKSIPIYTLDHDYQVMKKHYKLLVKQLHVDNKITFYKQCLLGVCGCMELGLGEVGLGLDMEGFTEFQANSMNKYEKLLIKIGEKSYMPSSILSLPVELQLCMTIIVQTMIFIFSKLLKNKIGFNLATLFQGSPEQQNLQMPK